MAQFFRLDVYNSLLDGGVVPLFYHPDAQTAIKIVTALARGGAKVIEFTNRGEMSLSVFSALVDHFRSADPTLILGIGSVIDAPTAALYIAHGANFVVGPCLVPEIARLCNVRKIAYIPGCATVTEITQAEELGVEICKLFPGEQIGGAEFVSAIMAPGPWHKLMPTGGVDITESSVTSWIKAGAAAVGLGSKLITKEAIAAADFDHITRTVEQVRVWIKNARALRHQ